MYGNQVRTYHEPRDVLGRVELSPAGRSWFVSAGRTRSRSRRPGVVLAP
jgi:hypothetical protein